MVSSRLRGKPISFKMSMEILERKRDAKTLKLYSKQEMLQNEAKEKDMAAKIQKDIDALLKR